MAPSFSFSRKEFLALLCFEFFEELASYPFSLPRTLREAGESADLAGSEAPVAKAEVPVSSTLHNNFIERRKHSLVEKKKRRPYVSEKGLKCFKNAQAICVSYWSNY